MATLRYNDYVAVVDYDPDTKLFHGRVVNVNSVIPFYGATGEGLEREFATSRETYFDLRRETGLPPAGPYAQPLIRHGLALGPVPPGTCLFVSGPSPCLQTQSIPARCATIRRSRPLAARQTRFAFPGRSCYAISGVRTRTPAVTGKGGPGTAILLR